jgi:hypothetical protein
MPDISWRHWPHTTSQPVGDTDHTTHPAELETLTIHYIPPSWRHWPHTTTHPVGDTGHTLHPTQMETLTTHYIPPSWRHWPHTTSHPVGDTDHTLHPTQLETLHRRLPDVYSHDIPMAGGHIHQSLVLGQYSGPRLAKWVHSPRQMMHISQPMHQR